MKSLYFFLSLLIAQGIKAQELEHPLKVNPIILQYHLQHGISAANTLRGSQQAIALPFIDDFSYRQPIPTASLWVDAHAFINTSMAVNPPTIGVATLDGLAANGYPYDSLSGITDTADYFTSQSIDLNYPNDTTIWLSFFFQPQGFADKPEAGDSLLLQFRDTAGQWITQWSSDGAPNQPFQQVYLPVRTAAYLYNNFQFRFLNFATLNGNRDHWHIDLVRLDRNRTPGDPTFEISFINPPISYLKDYTAMPYPHYKQMLINGLNPTVDTLRDTVRVLQLTSATSITLSEQIRDQSGNNIYNGFYAPIALTAVANTDTAFNYQPPAALFPSLPDTYMDFEIKHYISAANAGVETNDTNYLTQRFQNYYAYDDGSAELAYGIPENGARIAYQFDIKKADSLRGIQLYFNWVGPNEHNRLFTLAVWNSIGIGGGVDQLRYTQSGQRPRNLPLINGYVNYLFDSALYVNPGTLYIGWIQNQDSLISLGLDKNTRATSHMYAYFNGAWTQSSINGAWMLRPILSESPVAIGINNLAPEPLQLYPNPASHVINLSTTQIPHTLAVFDISGRQVLHQPYQPQLDISTLNPGYYTLLLYYPHTISKPYKFIKVRRH